MFQGPVLVVDPELGNCAVARFGVRGSGVRLTSKIDYGPTLNR